MRKCLQFKDLKTGYETIFYTWYDHNYVFKLLEDTSIKI